MEKKIKLYDKENQEVILHPETEIDQVVGLSSVLGAKADEATVNQYITQHAAEYTALNTKINNFLDVNDESTDQLSELITLLNTKKGAQEIATELEQYAKKSEIPDTSSFLTSAGGNLIIPSSRGQGLILKNSDGDVLCNSKTYNGKILELYSSLSGGDPFLRIPMGSYASSYGVEFGRDISPTYSYEASLGKSGRSWKNLYLSGNITDGTNTVSVAELKTMKDSLSGLEGLLAAI